MVHGLLMSPPPQAQPTSTRGGKGTGTGWGQAMLVSKKDQHFMPFKTALLHARLLQVEMQSRLGGVVQEW